ncbi:MAG: GNAT family N-acetyltransferase [Pseudomonadota bacterium]
MLIIEPADPRDDGPLALLEASHALMRATFPAEENYFLEVDELCADTIRFFAAREGAQTLGVGALAIKPGYGEVKSMFTAPEARGKGVAAALLRQIENLARTEGLETLRLETGDPLGAAIRLYERCGFRRCGIFGDYAPNQSSVYMEKKLS